MSTTTNRDRQIETSSARRTIVARRLSRLLGSLQVAVIFLPMFALVLFLGTLIESWYDAAVARQLVYQTWWFALLLGLLGVNILFAAVKKWPWKKRQTGFLITHVGLLCLVSGGMINSLSGIGGRMVLVDSDSFTASRFGDHQSNVVTAAMAETIQVKRQGSRVDEGLVANFQPGAVPWRSADYFPPPIEQPARLLAWLAHPWPRSWSRRFEANARIEVLEYLPHARHASYAADDSSETAFPAIEFTLASPSFGELPSQWVAQDQNNRRIGSARVEVVGHAFNEQQLAEFHQPQPAISLEDSGIRGVLQFVTDSDSQLHYRTFAGSTDEGLEFEQSGKIKLDQPTPIWHNKNWQLRVATFLPRAERRPHYVAVTRRLGQEDESAPPAIRCRLWKHDASTEFWLGRTADSLTAVKLGADEYFAGYNASRHYLDFDLTLLRAEQTLDHGSTQPASQTSYVLLSDQEQDIKAEPRIIRLNEPLYHRGYKIYQSQWRSVGMDENARPINLSVFNVRRDPGVRLKYAGSLMVGLGIACMFYMRAYFFRKDGKRDGAERDSGNERPKTKRKRRRA